jgi:hypothetical protein
MSEHKLNACTHTCLPIQTQNTLVKPKPCGSSLPQLQLILLRLLLPLIILGY